MDRPQVTRTGAKVDIKPTAPRREPVMTEVIRVIQFGWTTRSGTQPVIYLDRRRLD